jgi:hypothetical protein
MGTRSVLGWRRGLLLAIVALLSGALTAPSRAQEKKVAARDLPAAVSSAFAKAYPNAKITGSSSETEKGVKYYEIESMDGKTRRDLLYTADGKVSEIEETVPVSDLPAVVKSSFGKEFPKTKIDRVEKLTKNGTMTYELHFTSGKARKEVVIDPAGKIINGKMKSGEKEEDEKDEKDEDD